MRWFKHMSDSQNDEKMSELMDRFGAEGYGVWWLILERICQQMDKSSRTSARLSVKVWAKSCKVSAKNFQKLATFLEKIGIFFLEFDEGYLTIDCPNLAKYRDEWSSRKENYKSKTRELLGSNSGETPATEAEAETETETKTDTDIKKNTSSERKKTRSSPVVIPENIFISIHLVDGSEFPIGEELVEEYQKCYPGIDVRQSLRDIRAYFFSASEKRKTRRGILKCVNGWLERNQNRGGKIQNQTAQPRILNNYDRNQLVLEQILREEEAKYGKQNLIESGVTHDQHG